MKIKTAKLIGPALDWAVAQCEGKIYGYKHQLVDDCRDVIPYTPSTDWSQGGPIIDEMMEGEFFFMENDGNDNCHVAYSTTAHDNFHGYGTIPLIAACRCFVASRLGDEVDVPEELL